MNELEYRITLFAQLIAGMANAITGYILSDHSARVIANNIITGTGHHIVVVHTLCYMDREDAITINKMAKTLWTMIKHTDVSLLKDGYNG